MTDADKAAYAEAFSAAEKRAARVGHKIVAATWRNGHLSVTTEPVRHEAPSSPPEQGSLL